MEEMWKKKVEKSEDAWGDEFTKLLPSRRSVEKKLFLPQSDGR